MNKFFVFLALILTAQMAFAHTQGGGDSIGNGGDGIYVNEKLHLLDFVEAGIESSAHCSSRTTNSHLHLNYFRRIIKASTSLSEDVIDCFVTRIKQYDEFTQSMLVTGLLSYEIRFTQLELRDIQDEYSNLEFDRTQIKQIAVRRDQTIMIHSPLFEKLSLVSKAGLLMHEIIYAYLRPSENSQNKFKQESWRARQIVAAIFSDGALGPKPLGSFSHDGKPDLYFEDLREKKPFNLLRMGRNQSNGLWKFAGYNYVRLATKEADPLLVELVTMDGSDRDEAPEITSFCEEAQKNGSQQITVSHAESVFNIGFVDYESEAGLLKALAPTTFLDFDAIFGAIDFVGGYATVIPYNQELTKTEDCVKVVDLAYEMADDLRNYIMSDRLWGLQY